MEAPHKDVVGPREVCSAPTNAYWQKGQTFLRILVDIVHPADVLFFARPIRFWQARGDELLVLSRHKDVTCELLDEFGIAHVPITTASKGLLGLGSELLQRGFATWQHARRFRPDVMVGFGGVSISHAGKLLGIPALSFYDTEEATLQARVTWPFITHVFVPKSYRSELPKGRFTRVPGMKELSYLHPDGFSADMGKAIAAGLDPNCDNFLIRVVSWDANHDFGKAGWDEETLRSVIAHLPGKVHLSSERPLSEDLEKYRYRGALSQVHHLMSFCRLVVVESATMAAEAAILGVPTVFSGDFRGYIEELESSGLLVQADHGDLLDAIARMLGEDRNEQVMKRDRYVAEAEDWASRVIAAIDEFALG